MPYTRAELIKEAIKSKLGNGFTVFTSDDILTAANINESQIKELEHRFDEEAQRIADDTS